MRLAGWLSGFEPSHIGKQNKSLCLTLAAGVCRGGGWVGGKPSLPGAACSALSGSGGAPRVELLGRGSSFPVPPPARETHRAIGVPRVSRALLAGGKRYVPLRPSVCWAEPRRRTAGRLQSMKLVGSSRQLLYLALILAANRNSARIKTAPVSPVRIPPPHSHMETCSLS